MSDIFTGHKGRKSAKRIANLPATSSIRMGFVRNTADPQRMGRLQVWIPELGPDVESSWFTVSYASPFAGATNPADNIPDDDTQEGTQRSYGFWAVPPDIGNMVLVCFVNGDSARGFWFGCVYQQNMNHMVPSIGGSTSLDPEINDAFAPSFPPVAEYNKKKEGIDPKSPERAPFELANSLINQGLAQDSERGSTNSSARREDTSLTQGWSTPGGNHFVMDDNPENAFIRLRTRNGAQVMVSETSGFIYMITRDGKSWVEISDGAVEIFSEAPVSIRSQDDVNIRADRNLNLDAGQNVNIHAGASIMAYAAQDANIAAGSNFAAQSGGKSSLSAGSDMAIAGATTGISSSGDLVLSAGGANVRHGGSILDNSGGSAAVTPSDAEYQSSSSIGGSSPTICSRLPSHEPYDHPINAGDVEVSGSTVAVRDADGNVVNQPIVPDNSPVKSIAGYKVSEKVNNCIMQAALRTGQPYSHLMAIAAAESSFNPRAGAGSSSASGLFQFIDSTWAATYRKYGPNGTVVKNPTVKNDRYDPCSSALLGAYLYKENMAKLNRMGLSTGPTEGYIMHFLGEGGGPAFLKQVARNPTGSVSGSVSSGAIRGNSNIFRKSGGVLRTNKEAYNVLYAKIGGTVPQWEAYRKNNTDGK